MNVLVTGGTGALGRDLVPALRGSGHTVRVLSRRPSPLDGVIQGDLATGVGLDQAVESVEVIVHAASATTQVTKGRAVDIDGTRRLLLAAQQAGVKHVVFVSIVGMEGVAYPYYRTKLAAEAVVSEGMVPWTILRATQFHTLMEFFLGWFSRLPALCAVPYRWRFQPVDTVDVAQRLAEVVVAAPAGRLADFGGPEVRTFEEIARSWLRARHSRKRLVNLFLPLKASRQIASGQLTCPDHQGGRVTFEQYLARRYPRP